MNVSVQTVNPAQKKLCASPVSGRAVAFATAQERQPCASLPHSTLRHPRDVLAGPPGLRPSPALVRSPAG